MNIRVLVVFEKKNSLQMKKTSVMLTNPYIYTFIVLYILSLQIEVVVIERNK